MLRFFKGQPTDYVIRYRAGRIVNEGPGLAFYYLPYNTQIVAVPTSSTDANFVFNEYTSNFQEVTIQGQFAYRVKDARLTAVLLNFTINPVTRTYVSNDPERLPQRIANVIQMETRNELQKRSLEETLAQSDVMAGIVIERIRDEQLLEMAGVELLSVHFLAAKPTPEVAKALEAEYRETLLRKADEAIYARRAAAVEEEQTIKEKELNTQIVLEQQRKHLIDLEGKNALQEAENKGKALELAAESRGKATKMELAAYESMDPRLLLALGMQQIGQNAAKIGNLTITPDLLAEILGHGKTARSRK